jgi:hypothetical protein
MTRSVGSCLIRYENGVQPHASRWRAPSCYVTVVSTYMCLGPYAVDSTSNYAVNNVTGFWGMQVANLKTGQIITADIPNHPPGDAGLLDGIGWTPDQREVWESSSWNDPHIHIWDMSNPMAPVLKEIGAEKRSGSALVDVRYRGGLWLCRTK